MTSIAPSSSHGASSTAHFGAQTWHVVCILVAVFSCVFLWGAEASPAIKLASSNHRTPKADSIPRTPISVTRTEILKPAPVPNAHVHASAKIMAPVHAMQAPAIDVGSLEPMTSMDVFATMATVSCAAWTGKVVLFGTLLVLVVVMLFAYLLSAPGPNSKGASGQTRVSLSLFMAIFYRLFHWICRSPQRHDNFDPDKPLTCGPLRGAPLTCTEKELLVSRRVTPPEEVGAVGWYRVHFNKQKDQDPVLQPVTGPVLIKRGKDTDHVVVDFGVSVAGKIVLNVNNPDTRARLQIGYCESLQTLNPKGDAMSASTGAIYYPSYHDIPKDGLLEGPFHGGFRYVFISITRGSPVTINNAIIAVDIPLAVTRDEPYPGNFRCSEPLLNKIWYHSVHTLEISTDGCPQVFIDGGKRDRAIWMTDVTVQALATFTSNADLRAVRNSLWVLAAKQEHDGYIPHAHATDANPKIGITIATILYFAEYTCSFIITAWDYILHSGDVEFARGIYPTVQRAMHWLYERTDDSGLVVLGLFRGNPWHVPDLTTGKGTYANALAVMAIKAAIRLHHVAKEKDLNDGCKDADLNLWNEWLERIMEAMEKELWDDTLGVFMNTNSSWMETPVVVQDANAVCLLAGVASPKQSHRTLAYLKKHLHNEYGVLTSAKETPAFAQYISPYSTYLEMSARLLEGTTEQDVECLDIIRRCWGRQLEFAHIWSSTFWEKMSVDGKIQAYHQVGLPTSWTSLCHGWAAGPVHIMSTMCLGVRPETPGYSKASISPRFADLEWVDGCIPTPFGGIQVTWQRFNQGKEYILRIVVPAGVAASVELPAQAMPDGCKDLVITDSFPLSSTTQTKTWRSVGAPATFSIPNEQP